MSVKVSVKTKDHGWAEFWQRAEGLIKLRSARVRVGVLGDTQKGREARGAITLAELAAVLHYGTKDGKIPPRPYITMTFDAKRKELKELGAKLMAEVIFGHITLEQALNAMGSKFSAEVKNTIAAGVPPPNAPSTAIRKAMKGKGMKSAAAKLGRAEASYVAGKKGSAQKLARARDEFSQKFQASFDNVKPLIDTGRLLGAITWSVDLNGDKK